VRVSALAVKMADVADARPRVELGSIGQDIGRSSIGPMIEGILSNDRLHPEEWRHRDARDYLFALAKVADDLPFLTPEASPDVPSWQLFAYMLLAARDYDAE